MNQANQKQSYLVPFIIMVVLMSLVGLITNLNQQFQGPMKAAYLLMGGSITNMLTTGLTFSFFLAYLVMGAPSARYIENNGYKKTLTMGLIILIAAFGLYELSVYVFEAIDKATFAPVIEQARTVIAEAKAQALASGVDEKAAEVVASKAFTYTGETIIPVAYWVFLLAAFVAGSAMTFLQAVINPYIAACDVPGTTPVTRGAIAGSGNSSMTTIGPLLVAAVIFGGKSGLDISLTSLYIPFLILIVLVGGLIAALGKVNLPTIASAEKKEGEVLEKSVWSFSHLTLGVIAIFMYVGVEVAVGANINLYAESLGYTPVEGAKFASIYWGSMLVGRLCGSFLNKFSANSMLIATSAGAGILVTVGMIANKPWILIGSGLFHSIMWGAIFALAIDKLGKYTSAGSGALMMGVVGGAIMPFAQGIMADGMGWQWTWTIVILGEAYLLYYALVGYKVKQLP